MRCKYNCTCFGLIEPHSPVTLTKGIEYDLIKTKAEHQDLEYYIVKKDGKVLTTLSIDEVNNYFEKGE